MGLLGGAHLPYDLPGLAPTTLQLSPGFLLAPAHREGLVSVLSVPRCPALGLAPSKQLINTNQLVSELFSYNTQKLTTLQN